MVELSRVPSHRIRKLIADVIWLVGIAAQVLHFSVALGYGEEYSLYDQELKYWIGTIVLSGLCFVLGALIHPGTLPFLKEAFGPIDPNKKY